MKNFSFNFNPPQPDLTLLDFARRHEMDKMRRARYRQFAAACLLTGSYLLAAYAWGGWPW